MISPMALLMAQLGPDWTDSYIPADDAHLVRHNPSGLWCALDDEQIGKVPRQSLVALVALLRAAVLEGRQGEQVVSFEFAISALGEPLEGAPWTVRVFSKVGHGG